MAQLNRSKETIRRNEIVRRRIFWGVAALVSFYLLVPLIVGDMGVVKYFNMRRTYDRLQQEIQQLSDENQKIENEIHALRSDPDTIERIARDRLGLVRPGEVVYQFEAVNPAPSDDPPVSPTDAKRP
jgi:cell division protein FtsB